MSLKSLMLMLVLLPSAVLGQGAVTAPPDWSVPPMVPAEPPPMPPPPPEVQPGTPPPPGTVPDSSYVPGQQGKSGYQYSPYGQPKNQEKPGPEVGLMVSEALFGSLTAAGVTVLPYFLLFSNGTLGDHRTSPLPSILLCVVFGAAPLAVAQTQVSLANGSRYYQSETWVAALTGLVGEAAVLGVFYATGWLPSPPVDGSVPVGGSVAWLMIGSLGVVPLLQMAAINLFKQPKMRTFGTIGNPDKGLGVALAPPTIAPIFSPAAQPSALGVQVSMFRGRF